MTITMRYAFGMPKYVYVQLVNVEKPAKIRADKMDAAVGNHPGKYVIFLGDDQVGEFESTKVAGWWIQDESDASAAFRA
jgi:hypothetical protein